MARHQALLDLGATTGEDDVHGPGNFAPVAREQVLAGPFPVDGTLPPSLDGLYVRNGPNAALTGTVGRRWSEGDGMLHSLRLEGGRATAYRNRWVRTRRLAEDVGARRPRGPAQSVEGPANAGVLWHAGRLLALCGTGLPVLADADLATRGLCDFGGMLSSPMAAHPKVDPVSGGLTFVGHDPFGPPYLRYHEVDAGGTLVHSTDVAVPRPTLVRDLGVTATQVVFLDMPDLLCGPAPAAGLKPDYRWSPEVGARVGVLRRGSDGVATTWSAIDPCHVSHVVNAFDERRSVVLDVARASQSGGAEAPPGALLPRLERWRIHPSSGEVVVTVLDERAVEMPTVDPVVQGRPYRHAYCVELGEGHGAGGCRSVVQYDMARGAARVHRLAEGMTPGEPCFVRDPEGAADDEGWVLALVHDAGRGAADLVVLDASDFTGPPVATVHLPVRVPFGLHGCWVPVARIA